AAILGRALCFVRSGRGIAGHNSDLWHGIRPPDASRRTDAAAESRRLTTRARRGGDDLCATSWFQRTDGILGWAGDCVRSRGRGVLERVAQGARATGGARNDCGLADDFRSSAFARDWTCGGRKSAALPLERVIDLLFALSRSNRFCAHFFVFVLVFALIFGGLTVIWLVDYF